MFLINTITILSIKLYAYILYIMFGWLYQAWSIQWSDYEMPLEIELQSSD